MSANQAHAPIATMCRVLGVSESGFHAWRRRMSSRRAQRDIELRLGLRAAHVYSHGTYGAPRLLADLREAGYQVSQKRVARLMRTEWLDGVSKRRRPATDLVRRDFHATAPG